MEAEGARLPQHTIEALQELTFMAYRLPSDFFFTKVTLPKEPFPITLTRSKSSRDTYKHSGPISENSIFSTSGRSYTNSTLTRSPDRCFAAAPPPPTPARTCARDGGTTLALSVRKLRYTVWNCGSLAPGWITCCSARWYSQVSRSTCTG